MNDKTKEFFPQINDILVCPLFEYFSSLVSFIKKYLIHVDVSFFRYIFLEALQALAKQYPCSCISRIAPYRQGPQSLKCLPHCNLWAIQIYMLSDQKMYIFSNYYTTIRPIWILKDTWKKVISLNTILFAIKHATRGCGFS